MMKLLLVEIILDSSKKAKRRKTLKNSTIMLNLSIMYYATWLKSECMFSQSLTVPVAQENRQK